MTLSISDFLMKSDVTKHIATRQTRDGRWAVSWLPNQAVDYNQAITAMTLTEFVAQGVTDDKHQFWPHMKNFAGELGLTAEEAVHLIEGTRDDD